MGIFYSFKAGNYVSNISLKHNEYWVAYYYSNPYVLDVVLDVVTGTSK